MDGARSPQGSGRVIPESIGAIALVALAATAVAAVIPEARLAHRSLPLQAAFETAAGLVALLAAQLLATRFARTRARPDVVLAAALALLAATNLLFAAVPDIASDRDAAFAIWASALGTLTASLALGWGASAKEQSVGKARRAGWTAAAAVAGTLAVIAAVIAGLSPATGIDAARSPAASALLDAPPGFLAFQLAAACGFGFAAIGLAGRARRTGDELMVWFAAGATLAAVARVDYFLIPSSYGSWISVGDLLRIAFYLVLLVGLAREIRAYQRDLALSARAEERRRVARDLHDGLAQEVAFIAMIGERVEAGRANRADVRALRSAADRAASESRVLIDALRDSEERPLSAALTQSAGEIAARAGADMRLRVDDEVALPSPVRDAVLRIVQEGVANAVRHGGAARVEVDVAMGPEVRVRVVDDGAGFDVAAGAGDRGYGLTSMRQRAEALGGRLQIHSHPGQGTAVEAVLP
jgi:signal transduction histidine kinase